jgi:glycogen synthase
VGPVHAPGDGVLREGQPDEKGGLVFADILSTVSETYSREIQKEEYGHGLEGVLYERR